MTVLPTKTKIKPAPKPPIDLDTDDWETIDDSKQAEKIKKKLQPKQKEDEEKEVGEEGEDDIPFISKSAIDQEAIKLKIERALPPVPGKNLTLQEAREWFKLLDNQKKRDRLVIYLYRLHPIINRQMTNPDATTNIDVLRLEDVTEQYLLKNHGGGTYKLMVNDSERYTETKIASGNSLFVVKHTIPYQDHVPIINWEELDIGNKVNRGFITWAQGKGYLDTLGRPKETVMSANTNASTTDKLLDALLADRNTNRNNNNKNNEPSDIAANRAIDIVAKASETQMKLLSDKIGRDENAPKDMVSMMVQLMQIMKPVPPPPPEISVKDIMLLMQDSANKQMAMMQMMMEKSNPTSSKIGDLKDLIEISRLLGNSGPAPSITDRVIDVVSNNAPTLLTLFTNMMTQPKMGGQQPPAMPVTLDAQGNVVNPTMPIPGQPIMPMANQPTTNPIINQSVQGNGQPEMNPIKVQLIQVLTQNSPVIINAISTGTTGDVFADSTITMYGRGVYEMIKGLGKQELLSIFQSIPSLWMNLQNIAPLADIEQWISDFCDRDEIIKRLEMEESQDTPTKISPVVIPINKEEER